MNTTWHAMFYRLRPGTDGAVRAVLHRNWQVDTEVRSEQGLPVGGLLGSLALVASGTAAVAYEFEGPLPAAVLHLRTHVHAEGAEPALRPYLSALPAAECILVHPEGIADEVLHDMTATVRPS